MRCWQKCFLAALALVFLIGCSNLSFLLGSLGEKPEIKSIRPRITGIDLKGIDLAFDVDVFNPYGVAIKSPMFRYGLDLHDKPFLQSEEETKISLPSQDVGTVTLPVKLGYADIWKSYQSLKDSSEVPYRLHGALVLKPLGKTVELPMSKRGTFPVLRVPRFANVKVEDPEISLDSAAVGIKAAMSNPNIFALGLQELGYSVRLGDLDIGKVTASTLEKLEAGGTEDISLKAQLSGVGMLGQLLSGTSVGKVKILPTGSIETPYGTINLPSDQDSEPSDEKE